MPNKIKLYKSIAPIVILYFFVRWGLDADFICKVASETPQLCDYNGNGVISKFAHSVQFAFKLSLIVLLVHILINWIKS